MGVRTMNEIKGESFRWGEWYATTLSPVKFVNCNLVNAMFLDCQFDEVHFVNCDLTGAQFINCYPLTPDSVGVRISNCETNGVNLVNCLMRIKADKLVNALSVGCHALSVEEWIMPRASAQWQMGDFSMAIIYSVNEDARITSSRPPESPQEQNARSALIYSIALFHDKMLAEKWLSNIREDSLVREAERVIAAWMRDNPHFVKMLESHPLSISIDDPIYDWSPESYSQMETELAAIMLDAANPDRVRHTIRWK